MRVVNRTKASGTALGWFNILGFLSGCVIASSAVIPLHERMVVLPWLLLGPGISVLALINPKTRLGSIDSLALVASLSLVTDVLTALLLYISGILLSSCSMGLALGCECIAFSLFRSILVFRRNKRSERHAGIHSISRRKRRGGTHATWN